MVSDRLLGVSHRFPGWACSVAASLQSSPPISDGSFDRASMDRMSAGFLAGTPYSDALLRQLQMIHFWYPACVASHSLAAGLANYR
jgi:hypothetical protein